jgi:uncharacterized protein YbaR (Trm112 family)
MWSIICPICKSDVVFLELQNENDHKVLVCYCEKHGIIHLW